MGGPRFHHKSRSGCTTCKERRVKCDETKPACKRCQRMNHECFYNTPTKRAAPKASSDSPGSSNGSVSAHHDDDFDPVDLTLMAHYTTVTALDLFPGAEGQHFWQIELPQEARSKEHLMHGILGLAAMDLAIRSPVTEADSHGKAKYRARALHHQQRGIAMFQEFLTGERPPGNLEQLFVFSTMLVISTFAFALIEDVNPNLDDVIALFGLFRGSRKMWALAGESFKTSHVREVFYPSSAPHSTSDGLLQAVECFAAIQGENVYRDAAYRMLESQHVCGDSVFDIRGVGYWPCTCSEEFFSLLKIRHPGALAVLARYSFILAGYRSRWWIGDWSRLLLLAVDEEMSEDDKIMVGWNLEVLEMELAILTA